MITKKGLFVIKMLVSVGLLFYLLRNIDLGSIWQSLSSVRLSWLALAFSLHIVGYFISALRWQFLLTAQKVKIPLRALLSSYLIGTFFNNLLPTTIGGDAFRALDTTRYSKNAVVSVTTILVERATGIFALVAIAALALLFELKLIGNFPLIWILVGVLFITGIVVLFMLQPRIAGLVGRLFSLPGLSKLKDKAHQVYKALLIFKKEKQIFWKNMALAFLLQINVIIHYYLISLSLDLGVKPIHFFLLIPLITVILMVPVSINGIGIRENAFVVFLSKLGVAASSSISLSWVAYGMVVVYGIGGGVVYAIRNYYSHINLSEGVLTKKEGI